MAGAIRSAMIGEVLPLSLSQQEVWLDQRAWPDSTHLNIGGAGFIDGPFDLALFRQALQQLVDENDALRLVPLAEGGQLLLPEWLAELELVDVSAADEPLPAMRAWWTRRIAEPFAFDGRPPWRFALLCHSEQLHGLSIQFHHLIMDGWGTSRIMQRWAELYNVLAEGLPVSAMNDPGYRSFIAESIAYRGSPAFIKDGEFWAEQLRQLPPPLFIRRFPASAGGQLPAAHLHSQPLPRSVFAGLAAFAAEQGTTVFALLIAVFACYLGRAGAAREEVIIGLPSLNRGGKRYRDTPGMFVGVFPLVVKLAPQMNFGQLLQAVSLALKAAVRHQRYPLSELARRLELIRHRRDSLFDVLFSFERQDYDLHFGAGKSFGACQTFSGLARYPLGITLCEFQAGQDVELHLEASPEFFSATELGWLGQRLAHLAGVLVSDTERPLDDFPLTAPEELAVLQELAGSPLPPGQGGVSYIEQFRRQVALNPQACALVREGCRLDYAALDGWSDALAGRLHDLGAGANKIVALAIERSPAMVAALLAIGKSGAAFLPLDPDAPLARLEGILADAGAIALLVQPELAGRFAALPVRQMIIGEPEIADAHLLLPPPAAESLAYVLYTSGSTGRPKGVMVSHRALAVRLAGISRLFAVTPADCSGQVTQLPFDPSLIELLVPLTNGARIALPPPGRLAPLAIGSFVVDHGVTMMALVPSTLRGLLDSLPDGQPCMLRVACCGGETLSPELVGRWQQQTGAQLFNVYGPTEALIFATAWDCRQPLPAGSLPIGRAIDGARILVLDEKGDPRPFGVIGEICIGGAGLADAYLNQPAATRAAFVDDPFVTGARLYRSGDLGWLADDGLLHFVGRRDRQVKLRGYRVELGEVESTLLAIDGVWQAAVKLVEAPAGARLQAWVASSLSAERLRSQLASRLPDYMLPGAIACLPELPLGATGKIAYDLLPTMADEAVASVSRPPSSDLERSLLAIWRLALKNDGLGVNDNFFAAGGDSLAAIDILTALETLLERPIPLFVLTEHPSVELLAAALMPERGDASQDILLPLNHPSGRPAIFLAASGHGDLMRFRRLAGLLAETADVFMLQPPADSPISSINQLAEAYAGRIVEMGRPALLAGFSVGGIAALETARQLRAGGFPVSHLCLIDTVFPGAILRSAVFWRFLGWSARHLNVQQLSLNGRHLGALLSDRGLLAQIEAIASYRPAPCAVAASLIKSTGMLRWERWVFRPWRRLFSAGLQEREVPGLHGSLFEVGNITELARMLRLVIDNSSKGIPSA
jgi:amino acid adenylation domain-containing protein